jgi:bifunctional UDP-N-acetylglucosamine pyrophosphorylase/glucosamine-1-phosphate N-acetyltransferase
MGKRMKSDLPKVLHPVNGRPMILEVLDTARAMAPEQLVLVVGHGAEQVRELVGSGPRYALQAEQLGTGHAVMEARKVLVGSEAITVLVLYGDTPLIHPDTLARAFRQHRGGGAVVTLLSFLPQDPTGYGRIIRDEHGAVLGIVEHRDATEEQKAIQESNSGIMFFNAPWLWENLSRLEVSPQGEYYLTDLVSLAVKQGCPVGALVVDEQEVMGINDREQLAQASQILRQRHQGRDSRSLEHQAGD